MANRSLLCWAAILMTATTSARAEVNLGVDSWGWHLSGSIQNQGDRLDFGDDLSIQPRGSAGFRLGWQPQEAGWMPGVQAQSTRLVADGRSEVAAGTQFGPITFTAGGPVTGGPDTVTLISRADLIDRDVLLHWRYEWAGWHWQPGLRVRQLDGDILVRDEQGNRDQQRFDEWFPMLHLGAELGSGRPASLRLAADWISDGDNQAYEWSALLDWAAFGPLSLRLGWQVKRYEILDAEADYRLSALMAGPVVGLSLSIP